MVWGVMEEMEKGVFGFWHFMAVVRLSMAAADCNSTKAIA